MHTTDRYIQPVGYFDPPDDHYYCAVCDHECNEDCYRTWRRECQNCFVCDDCADADEERFAEDAVREA